MEIVRNFLAAVERNLIQEAPFYAQLAAVLLVGILADLARSRNLWRRYVSRRVLTDVAYTAWYGTHLYELLLLWPVVRILDRTCTLHAPWLRLGLLSDTPGWFQIVMSILVLEFLTYWYHRAQHASPWLWQLHKIHHSQQELTALTTARVHVVDRLLVKLMLFFPPLILGAAPESALAVQIVLTVQGFLIHSDLGWSMGSLGRVVVSPAFHEIHHSVERAQHDSNFGALLTIWDQVFGTATPLSERPVRYGLRGDDIPESFARQLFVPLVGCTQLMKASWRARQASRVTET